MQNRIYELELLDLGSAYYTQQEYGDCLKKLSAIGRHLGGNKATLQAFEDLGFVPTSILDVGFGEGAFSRMLAKRYARTSVLGIELSHDAVRLARAQEAIPNLRFEHRDDPELKEKPKSFDIVTATLVCHHLTNEQLVEFLRAAKAVARKGIILNDLHRHRLAYALFWLISPLFRNRLIRHDGLISIRRSFTRLELESILAAAGFEENAWQIRWRWAFRWIVTIKVPT